MRFIKRLPKPRILEEKEETWTKKFIESGKARAHNEQYGHKEIKETLEAMSYNKCFYCERKLDEADSEIDHYIEIADPNGKELAFKWANLYLSCKNCNDKIDNQRLPATNALNPCEDSDEVINETLQYVDGELTAKSGNQKGLDTIRKFKLNSELLSWLRSKQLLVFKNTLIEILQKVQKEERSFNEEEKALLLRFDQPDQPYSLMFKQVLKKHKILD